MCQYFVIIFSTPPPKKKVYFLGSNTKIASIQFFIYHATIENEMPKIFENEN